MFCSNSHVQFFAWLRKLERWAFHYQAGPAVNKFLPLGLGVFVVAAGLSSCGRAESVLSTFKGNSPAESAEGDYGNFNLLPDFYPDPAIGTGLSGGTVPATQLAGVEGSSETCVGFVNESPAHKVNLQDNFNHLNFSVESPEPVLLVVVSEMGDRWCAVGRQPIVEGDYWSSGRYNVYVGNPDAPEVGDRYELLISEINLEDYQPISIAPGFEPDPAIGTGYVGGSLSAIDVAGTALTETGDCEGFVDSSADHQLTLEQPFQFLKVLASSDEPTSLVILGPNGESWCSTGDNPYIEGVWDAGEYEVYLANPYSKQSGARYELRVTEIDE